MRVVNVVKDGFTEEWRENKKKKNRNIDLCVLRAFLQTGAAGVMPLRYGTKKKKYNKHSAGKETVVFLLLLLLFFIWM